MSWGAFAQVAADIGKEYWKVQEAKDAAHDQRSWQTQMSNTAHVREVDDLRKAGLNPILSANSGASTPSGAAASIQGTSSVAGNVSSASQYKRVDAEIDNLKASTDKAATEAALNSKLVETQDYDQRLKAASAVAADEQAKTSREQQALLRQQAAQVGVETTLSKTRIPGANVESEIDNTPYGRVTRYINRALEAIGVVGKTAASARASSR